MIILDESGKLESQESLWKVESTIVVNIVSEKPKKFL